MIKNKSIRIKNMSRVTDYFKEDLVYKYCDDATNPDAFIGKDEVLIKDNKGYYFGDVSKQGYLIAEGIEF